jgi:hypothetical protein
MLNRLFPEILSNAYQGSWAAVWLLVPVLILKTVIGFNLSGLNPFVDVGEILRSADGVPLDTFTPAAAARIIDAAGAWGMAMCGLCLAIWLIVIRYRAGLPIGILILLIEQTGRTGAGTVRLIAKLAAGAAPITPGAIINLTMTTLLILAFALALLRDRLAGSRIGAV